MHNKEDEIVYNDQENKWNMQITHLHCFCDHERPKKDSKNVDDNFMSVMTNTLLVIVIKHMKALST